jgi:hypothetical protein
MSTNKRDLKAYVRYDGSGRVVAGSLILRRNKPKVGNWQQVQGYECCNQNQSPVLVDTGELSFPLTYASLEVGPQNGDWYQRITSYTDLTAADINGLASIFNASFKNLGYFKVIDGDLYWTPNAAIAEFYTLNHTTGLYAYAFSD